MEERRTAPDAATRVGRAIQQVRSRKGLSQRSFAAKLGISSSAVAQWELGETMPTLSNLLRASVILRTPLSHLAEGAGISHVVTELDADEATLIYAWRQLSTKDKAAVFHTLTTFAGLPTKRRRKGAPPKEDHSATSIGPEASRASKAR